MLKYKNVFEQYIDNQRYLFHCDFYVEDLDTFIKLNLHRSHGYRPFEGTESDISQLSIWQERAEASDY